MKEDELELELVYQPVPPDGSSDVFASALKAVCDGSETIAIASPYLSYDVLEPITRGLSFRLITDLEACLEGGVERSLAGFFEAHSSVVRSLRGLHAKVVLGTRAGLLGSANLTTTGLCRRFEMACVARGVHFDELVIWFDRLWKHAVPLDLDAVRAGLDQERDCGAPDLKTRSTKGLTTTGNMGWLTASGTEGAGATDVQSERARESVLTGKVSDQDLDELAKQLRVLTTTRATALRALSLFDEALRLIDLPIDDDRLHLNFGGASLSITLGPRYVVWLRKEKKTREFGMLLADFDVARRHVAAREDVRSSAFRDKGKPDVPSFYWPPDKLTSLPEDVVQSWHEGIRRELARRRRSPYTRAKRAALYHVVIDSTLRTEVVRRAHPQAWWFGVNNSNAGHMTLGDIMPLFYGSPVRWPIGSSKTVPGDAYAEMLPGDRALVWTGHGREPRWGVIGTAGLASVEQDHVILDQGHRFEQPLTPYPRRAPAETNAVKFMFRVFDEDFKPLGDVRQAIHGVGRTNPITIAKIEEAQFDEVVRYVTENSGSA